ncbi:MAG: hypothetical protein H0W72_08365 [Planctomycetes bacterium]|nr:hypothetical protein [Planctomycetota bacterium]
MGLWDLINDDADQVCADTDGATIAATYTPPGGAAVAVRGIADERAQVVSPDGDGHGQLSRRFLAFALPAAVVADPRRGALLAIASGVYAGEWKLETVESRMPSLIVCLYRYERPLSVSGAGARKGG